MSKKSCWSAGFVIPLFSTIGICNSGLKILIIKELRITNPRGGLHRIYTFKGHVREDGQGALMGLGIGAVNGTVSGFKYAHDNNVNPWNGLSNERIQMDKLPIPEIKPLETQSINTTESISKVHGNSLQSQKPTWGYKLYSNDEVFLKNGITSNPIPETRYTKSYMKDKYMIKIQFPNRAAAYQWEYQQNLILRGPLNLNMH
ncbi:MAG: hypothetical protein ACK5MA_08230 [Parachlamydiaceae bacterium]